MRDTMDVEVRWYGQTCFRLRGQNSISIVTDPYPPDVGLLLPRLQADIVTVSQHNASCDHLAAVQGPFKLLDGPGEYEISGVFITGVSTFADSKHGRARGLNTVFAFDFDGTTICHLGRLGHVPTQSQVKNVGSVNVLLVPVGGGGSLTSTQASEVIGLFEPDLVVPMRYRLPGLQENLDDIDHFLKEMGMEDVDGQKTLKVSEAAVVEETKIVQLEPIEDRQ
jgi:L-ascorbate metabolism protein UlaG (beta-lactamase superfamily)